MEPFIEWLTEERPLDPKKNSSTATRAGPASGSLAALTRRFGDDGRSTSNFKRFARGDGGIEADEV